MVLLDAIVELDDEQIEAKVTITSDSMFLRDGRVRSIVCLEYMAQAVAAFAGIRRKSAGEAPKIGYIIGVPSMELEVDGFEIGDELQVHAKHVWGEGELGRFDCRVERGPKQVAKASLSVYSGDIET